MKDQAKNRSSVDKLFGSLIAEGYVYADDAADLDDGADIRIRLGFLQTLMLATRSKVAA
ncbi:hypothetical protein ACVNHC_22545 [Pannonibacter sp. Q-1]|jgi:hypothetical protein|uniref:Uncharacterized protein n=5 Tax=Hyphomicrobiales TaxID=356 RepID=A0A7W5Z7Q3_9HYPH|nr:MULTISPECIES: hypothetical protein [Alphaproteobacteria]MCG6116291.1 hypothetical protein [Mesorhizobium sp.]ABS15932.1 hypothetical protein Oant_3224 [Brucella anthropi ATCC 49188]AIK41854.1 hypothetical protein DR92_3268 [Brucella anthropi]MBB3811217.1 hypothetical protein [Pseudochelatococcus contaminans]MBE0560537.1 hypothetical protein [Brucella anthropi]|tara:strand:- start:386 stop:562 length:177 start_codon:yes stop_codon:yes gene_type:complete